MQIDTHIVDRQTDRQAKDEQIDGQKNEQIDKYNFLIKNKHCGKVEFRRI